MAEVKSSQASSQTSPQAIHHELRNAQNSAAFALPRIEKMKERSPNLTLLDVGAGSGTISASLAKILPEGKVTALDLNPNILARAKTVAAIAGVENISFQQGDAKKLPFADSTFDITFCHQILTHIVNPKDALREMLRVTRPGGIVAVREGDFETEVVWPQLPGLLKFHKFAADLMLASGGTVTAGRQLLSWSLSAGIERSDITLTFGTWTYNTADDKKTWAEALVDRVKGGPMREKGVKAGFTTENDLEEMANDWKTWARELDSGIAMLHGELIIQK